MGLEFCSFNGHSAADIAIQVASHCQQNGCIVAAADGIIRINPPLNMSQEECEMMTDAIVTAVNSVATLINNKLKKE